MVVLITSVGTATAVNFVKFLRKQKNIRIVGTDVYEMGYTAGSILSNQFYQVPYAYQENYIPAIREIIRKENVDYIIPVNDAEIEKVSLAYADGKLCKSLIPDYETVVLTRNKRRCNDFAESIGIAVPKEIEKDAFQKRICRDITGVGSKGIAVYEKNECMDLFEPKTQMVQEFIEGVEYTADVLCSPDGRPVYVIPRKRLEVKNGVATKVVIENHQALIAEVCKMLERIRLPGLSNIQFLEDAQGNLWFIEINCRFSGCGAGTAMACKDFLPVFFSMLEGRKIEKGFNEGVKWNAVVTRYYEEVMYEKENGVQPKEKFS